MRVRSVATILLVTVVMALSGCATKFRTYNGPEVTRIVVQKSERKMYLLHGADVLKVYDIQLGGNPYGPKQYEGDMKTPEGSYFINRRNPNSAYHLSLGISYPTPQQVADAAVAGRRAGGDIFIHGLPNQQTRVSRDWTAGCIAVPNKDIENIYAMVRDGTQIDINP